MKLITLIAAGVLSLVPLAANAGDVSVDDTAFSWTGGYVGLAVGRLGITSDNSYSTYRPGSDWTDSHEDTSKGTGFLAGVTIGYNYQMDNVVLGIEGDYSLANAQADAPAGDDVWYGAFGTSEFSSFGTARVRLGFALDRTMVYATGGLAIADIEQSAEHSRGPISFSEMRTGWTAGGGIEHALTDSVTVKAEALYADFGSESDEWSDCGDCRRRVYEADTTAVIVRVGSNLKF